MSFFLVPLHRRDFDFFDRQRDLFGDWLHMFDDDWREMELPESQRRFESELERFRNELHRMDVQPIALDIEPPIVTDPEGNKKLSLRFACNQFKPEEIHVKTQDNVLSVHAKHLEESKGRKVQKEFRREYTLPDTVDPKTLKSHLTSDGILHIEAPVHEAIEAPKEILIPIERLESKEVPEKKAKTDEKTEEEEVEEEKK